MKETTEITITSTHSDGEKWSTTVKSEGLNMEVLHELMIRGAIGHGFSEDTVKNHLGE